MGAALCNTFQLKLIEYLRSSVMAVSSYGGGVQVNRSTSRSVPPRCCVEVDVAPLPYPQRRFQRCVTIRQRSGT